MGNLGRAGYGATTEGTWPYSYDSCDVGTFPNQTRHDNTPQAALDSGTGGGTLSYQPGQKLSACTCAGSDHPGPSYKDGRSAPEIDLFEALVNLTTWQGEASQSLQAAPYSAYYNFDTTFTKVYDDSKTFYNSYKGNGPKGWFFLYLTHYSLFPGGVYQQSISAHSHVGTTAYNGSAYQTFGVEYWSDQNSRDAGLVTWFLDGSPTWTMNADAIAAEPLSGVGRRLVPEEPMVSGFAWICSVIAF